MNSVSSPPATKITCPGWAASSRAASPGRGDQAGRGLLRRVLEEGRREPHFEPEAERDLGDRGEPSDVAAHDPHGVGVQVIPDDLELAAHHRQVECRPARRNGIARAAEHRPRVVVDALVLHLTSILATSGDARRGMKAVAASAGRATRAARSGPGLRAPRRPRSARRGRPPPDEPAAVGAALGRGSDRRRRRCSARPRSATARGLPTRTRTPRPTAPSSRGLRRRASPWDRALSRGLARRPRTRRTR